jgi:hypothetical protein
MKTSLSLSLSHLYSAALRINKYIYICIGVKNRFNSSAYKKWASEMKLVLNGTCVRRKRKDLMLNSTNAMHRSQGQQLQQIQQQQQPQLVQLQQLQHQQQQLQHMQHMQNQLHQQGSGGGGGESQSLNGVLSVATSSQDPPSVPQLPEVPLGANETQTTHEGGSGAAAPGGFQGNQN